MPNVSRSKGNQTTKFGQLIEHNMIFFFKNHTQNVVKKPRPFSEKIKSAYLWIIYVKFYTICFHCMPSWGLPKYIETKQRPFAFTSFQVFFKKTKWGLQLASLPHFFHIFRKNLFLLLYSINWSSFIVWLPLLHKILDNMSITIVC